MGARASPPPPFLQAIFFHFKWDKTLFGCLYSIIIYNVYSHYEGSPPISPPYNLPFSSDISLYIYFLLYVLRIPKPATTYGKPRLFLLFLTLKLDDHVFSFHFTIPCENCVLCAVHAHTKHKRQQQQQNLVQFKLNLLYHCIK